MSAILLNPYEKHVKYTVPVPDSKLVPVTASSVPFNAAVNQTDPTDLSRFGYLEEEYFVSGEANVYARFDYGPDLMVKIRNAPYTFRILVRKPRDARMFSGHIMVEIMNYASIQDIPATGWGELDEYMLRQGDAFVGVTVQDVAFNVLRTYDPVRYAPLNDENPIPPAQRRAYVPIDNVRYPKNSNAENGLMYDVLSQVAMLCRSGKAGSPFEGYAVEYMFVTGASSGNLAAYAGSVHDYAMRDETRHVYDGFLLKMTSSTGQMNNEEPKIAVPDPRSTIRPKVPTMRLITMGDLFGVGMHRSWAIAQRRPDTDEPGDQFRLYEIPGTRVGNRDDKLVSPSKASAERAGVPWKGPDGKDPRYSFPCYYFTRAAYDNLKKWVKYGITPPYAKRMGTNGGYPDGHPDRNYILDGAGNITGGLRTPLLDVPIATYRWNGEIFPFGREELVRRYTDRFGYTARFSAAVQKAVTDRFILPEDALELLTKMIGFDFGFDW